MHPQSAYLMISCLTVTLTFDLLTSKSKPSITEPNYYTKVVNFVKFSQANL